MIYCSANSQSLKIILILTLSKSYLQAAGESCLLRKLGVPDGDRYVIDNEERDYVLVYATK